MAGTLRTTRYSRMRLATTQRVSDENGNTVTFWGREEAREVPAAVDDDWYEVEKEGERLYDISAKHYGTPLLDWVIAVANDLELPDEEVVPGVRLRIPGSSTIQRLTR